MIYSPPITSKGKESISMGDDVYRHGLRMMVSCLLNMHIVPVWLCKIVGFVLEACNPSFKVLTFVRSIYQCVHTILAMTKVISDSPKPAEFEEMPIGFSKLLYLKMHSNACSCKLSIAKKVDFGMWLNCGHIFLPF